MRKSKAIFLVFGVSIWMGGCSAQTTPEPVDDGTASVDAVKEKCIFQIAMLKDMSFSEAPDLSEFQIQSLKAMKRIKKKFPGSEFSYHTFVDKPIPPLGWPQSLDYCYWQHDAFTENLGAIEISMNEAVHRSGADGKEGQFDAAIAAMVNPTTGWNPSVTENGKPVVKLVFIFTDARPHIAGDGLSLGLTPNNEDGILDCITEDYASLKYYLTTIQINGVKNVVFAPPDVIETYQEIGDSFGDEHFGSISVPLMTGLGAQIIREAKQECLRALDA